MLSPAAQREFAVDVVRRLRGAGFEAVWAGGCVRDRLLGLAPKDYDVATNATPEQVREVFGRRRTIPVGAAFGVIAVPGPKPAGTVEVATFRRDVSYSDGRRPDAVAFTTAEEDAQRRDFTINGLFYDPLDDRVLDYVGGQEDLKRGIVRAIGEPRERFAEDKLRMLRAVRIAAAFEFALDSATLAAVQQMASGIVVVSAERIAAELRRMLTDPRRERAVSLLAESKLLAVLLPEAGNAAHPDSSAVARAMRLVAAVEEPSFALALAALLFALSVEAQVADIGRRWRLSNDEVERTQYLVAQATTLDAVAALPWPKVQRMLVHPYAPELVALHAARAGTGEGNAAAVAFCRERLAWPAETLNPPPLLTGDDLKRHGIRPGPKFKTLLEEVRDAQLEGRIGTKEEAIRLAEQIESRTAPN
ncbi:MAG: CCA tRNA nucleotidyltransferase [Planctomycetaceae bacterium]|nr:CCA tRNA nucleotidyltransferase [Planctomycetaceae bacterium]